MEAIVEDKEYAYFQPGGMMFFLTTASDRWLKSPRELEIDAEAEEQMDDSDKNLRRAQIKKQVDDKDNPPYEKSFDEQVDALIKWSNEKANEMGLRIVRRPDKELHFPGTQNLPKLPSEEAFSNKDLRYKSPEPKRRGAFSMIPVDVRRITSEDRNQEENKDDGYVDVLKLANLAGDLDQARVKGQTFLRSGITLQLITPNWLSSPTSETGGGGGPGSRPEPYTGPSHTDEHKFQLPKTLKGLCPSNPAEWGKGVKVAVLDTAPSAHDLVAAFEHYHKVNPAKKKQDHSLLESLLAPRDPQDPRPPAFTLHPASTEDLMRMRSVHLKDHNYNMTDHGLFVSGIIHSIAPAAEIHLYEVLNSEGVGDLESIANGLWKVAYEQYREFVTTGRIQPLVVNCSLMLNLPLQGDPDDPENAAIIPSSNVRPLVGHRLIHLDEDLLKKIKDRPDWLLRAGEMIMWICDILFWCGARVVAAAGNDWKPDEDQGRPRARYMAAFESVQGVGALQKPQNQTAIQTGQYDIATYSDLSDEPGRVGVATLGGEAGDGKGVLGLYLGEFPLPDEPLRRFLMFLQNILRWLIPRFNGISIQPKNLSHWAWWAGTSFATPILSGVVAAVLSQPNSLRTTEGAIRKLYDSGTIQESRTEYQEDLLNVTQGRLPP
jgi:hypothetical protein